MNRMRTGGLAGLAAIALVAAGTPALAGTTTTTAEVIATSSAGQDAASDAGPTTLELEGSGFQSITGGFGGIYVAFGWVSGDDWAPSDGGTSGVDYLYLADGMTAETNTGALRFIAFPGSSTSEEAQGTMAEDGSWSTTLEVPGPVVTLSDSGGSTREVDCRTEQCGVLTFGAHGVKNANNETFTPIEFVAATAEPSASATPEESAEPEASETPEASESASAPAQPSGEEASASASADPTATESEGGGSAVPWLIGGAVALLAVAAAVAGALSRGRREGD